MNLDPSYPEPSKISIVFCDTITHCTKERYTDEIKFFQPIFLSCFRIARSNINIHASRPQSRSFTTSNESITRFSLFVRDLQNPQSKFKKIVFHECANPNPLSQDTLIPIPGIFTDHVILRGEYTTLTIIMYGYTLSQEQTSLLQNVSFIEDVQILKEKKDQQMRISSVTQQENHNIYKAEKQMGTQVGFHVCMDNIRPFLLFDKEGFTEYDEQESVLGINRITSLLNYCQQAENQEDTTDYLLKLQNVNIFMEDLLGRNGSMQTIIAHFDDSQRAYQLIPQSVTAICLFALKGQFDHKCEAFYALSIAKTILSSREHAIDFIQGGGLEIILQFLKTSKNQLNHIIIQLNALEIIYLILNYDFGTAEFLQKQIKNSNGFVYTPEYINQEQVTGYQFILNVFENNNNPKILSACTLILNKATLYDSFERLRASVKILINKEKTSEKTQSLYSIIQILEACLKTLKSICHFDKKYQNKSFSCALEDQYFSEPNFDQYRKYITEFQDFVLNQGTSLLLESLKVLPTCLVLLSCESLYSLELFEQSAIKVYKLINFFLSNCQGGLAFLLRSPKVTRLLQKVLTQIEVSPFFTKKIYFLGKIKKLLQNYSLSTLIVHHIDMIYILLMNQETEVQFIKQISEDLMLHILEIEKIARKHPQLVAIVLQNPWAYDIILHIIQENSVYRIMEYSLICSIVIQSIIFKLVLPYKQSLPLVTNPTFFENIVSSKNNSTEIRTSILGLLQPDLSKEMLSQYMKPFYLFKREGFQVFLKEFSIASGYSHPILHSQEYKIASQQQKQQDIVSYGKRSEFIKNLPFLETALGILDSMLEINKGFFLSLFEANAIAIIYFIIQNLVSIIKDINYLENDQSSKTHIEIVLSKSLNLILKKMNLSLGYDILRKYEIYKDISIFIDLALLFYKKNDKWQKIIYKTTALILLQYLEFPDQINSVVKLVVIKSFLYLKGRESGIHLLSCFAKVVHQYTKKKEEFVKALFHVSSTVQLYFTEEYYDFHYFAVLNKNKGMLDNILETCVMTESESFACILKNLFISLFSLLDQKVIETIGQYFLNNIKQLGQKLQEIKISNIIQKESLISQNIFKKLHIYMDWIIQLSQDPIFKSYLIFSESFTIFFTIMNNNQCIQIEANCFRFFNHLCDTKIGLSRYISKENPYNCLDDCLSIDNILTILSYVNNKQELIYSKGVLQWLVTLSQHTLGQNILLYSNYQKNVDYNAGPIISLVHFFDTPLQQELVIYALSIIFHLLRDEYNQEKLIEKRMIATKLLCGYDFWHQKWPILEITLKDNSVGLFYLQCVKQLFQKQTVQDFEIYRELIIYKDFQQKLEKAAKVVKRFKKFCSSSSFIKNHDNEQEIHLYFIMQDIQSKLKESREDIFYNQNVIMNIQECIDDIYRFYRYETVLSLQKDHYKLLSNYTDVFTGIRALSKKTIHSNFLHDSLVFPFYRQNPLLQIQEIQKNLQFQNDSEMKNALMKKLSKNLPISKKRIFQKKNYTLFRINPDLIIQNSCRSLKKDIKQKNEGLLILYQGSINLQTNFSFPQMPQTFLAIKPKKHILPPSLLSLDILKIPSLDQKSDFQIDQKKNNMPQNIAHISNFYANHLQNSNANPLQNTLQSTQYNIIQNQIQHSNQITIQNSLQNQFLINVQDPMQSQLQNGIQNTMQYFQSNQLQNQIQNPNQISAQNPQYQFYYNQPLNAPIQQPQFATGFIGHKTNVIVQDQAFIQTTEQQKNITQVIGDKNSALLQKMKQILKKEPPLSEQDENMVAQVKQLQNSKDPNRLEKIKKIMEDCPNVKMYFWNLKQQGKK